MSHSRKTVLIWMYWLATGLLSAVVILTAISFEMEATEGRHFWNYVLSPPPNGAAATDSHFEHFFLLQIIDPRSFTLTCGSIILACLIPVGIRKHVRNESREESEQSQNDRKRAMTKQRETAPEISKEERKKRAKTDRETRKMRERMKKRRR